MRVRAAPAVMLMIMEPGIGAEGASAERSRTRRRGTRAAFAAVHEMYSRSGGRHPPERLLKASLLMGSTPCAANGFLRELDYTCCSAGSRMMWRASFDTRPSRHRARLLEHDWRGVFHPRVAQARQSAVVSDEHLP